MARRRLQHNKPTNSTTNHRVWRRATRSSIQYSLEFHEGKICLYYQLYNSTYKGTRRTCLGLPPPPHMTEGVPNLPAEGVSGMPNAGWGMGPPNVAMQAMRDAPPMSGPITSQYSGFALALKHWCGISLLLDSHLSNIQRFLLKVHQTGFPRNSICSGNSCKIPFARTRTRLQTHQESRHVFGAQLNGIIQTQSGNPDH